MSTDQRGPQRESLGFKVTPNQSRLGRSHLQMAILVLSSRMKEMIIRTDLVIAYRLSKRKRDSAAWATSAMTFRNLAQSLHHLCNQNDNSRVDCVSPTFDSAVQSRHVDTLYLAHVCNSVWLHVLFHDTPQLLQVYCLDLITFVTNRSLSHADRIVDSFLCCVSCGLK